MIYPAAYNITIEQRASFDRTFQFKDRDGEALDLTGYTVRAAIWTAKRRKLIDFTLTWIDQAEAHFTLSLTDEQTTTLSGSAVWDLWTEDEDDIVNYYLRGQVLIEPGYTV